MSEGDKQLTVAELMARAGKTSSGRSRRRRRLEEGGVSVAELTGSLPKVDEVPADARHTSQPLEAENTDRLEPEPLEETTVIPVVAPEPQLERPAADVEETGEIAVVTAPEPESVATQDGITAAQLAEIKAAQQDVDGEIQGFVNPYEQREETLEGVDKQGDEEDDGPIGLGPVILMAVVGVVLAGVIFVVFQFLWGSGMNPLVVAALGVVVTAVMVWIVHAMHTTRDGLTKTLAGVVGVLVTFGPALPMIF